jgi:hypothetical protein
MKNAKPKRRVTFSHTRRAIKKIKQRSIRDDFAEMLHGIEFCFANRQKGVALKCANALVGMAIGLNRTISPAVATGILFGLLKDRKQDVALLGGGGLGYIEYHFEEACVNAACVESKGGVCITIDGAGGCGNRFGFQFPWRVAIA